MQKNNNFQLLILFLSGVALLFIVAPLAGLMFSSSLEQLGETVIDKEVGNSIVLTLATAFFATVSFAVAGIPLAYLLARREFTGKKLISGIIDLPVVIPHTAAGIAVLGVISKDTLLGKAASSVGLDFVGNPLGIAVAMAFVSVPFLVNAARDGFAAVSPRLEKAALNLGASPARVFFTVSLPLAKRSIISGAIMMFARGMSEFGAVVIVAYHPMITPVLIYERFGAFGLQYARPVSVIFILVSLLFFILLRLVSGKRSI